MVLIGLIWLGLGEIRGKGRKNAKNGHGNRKDKKGRREGE